MEKIVDQQDTAAGRAEARRALEEEAEQEYIYDAVRKESGDKNTGIESGLSPGSIKSQLELEEENALLFSEIDAWRKHCEEMRQEINKLTADAESFEIEREHYKQTLRAARSEAERDLARLTAQLRQVESEHYEALRDVFLLRRLCASQVAQTVEKEGGS